MSVLHKLEQQVEKVLRRKHPPASPVDESNIAGAVALDLDALAGIRHEGSPTTYNVDANTVVPFVYNPPNQKP